MLPITTDVLIVGAGPTGLALALSLQRAGRSFILVDRLASGENTSRAAVIHAHTLDMLEAIGVSDTLIADGTVLKRFDIRDRDRVLVDLDFTKVPSRHPYLLMIPQNETERILEHALETAGGRAHRGRTVEKLETVAEGVVATIASPDGVETIHARFVVGADGMHSVVRDAAGIGFAGAPAAESFVLADVALDWPEPVDDVMLFFSPEGLMVVAPLPGGTFRIVATYPDAPGRADVPMIQAIIDQRGPSGSRVRVKSVGWSSRFRINHRLADSYRKGPFLLLGDAAHVHSPAGGQGMNTGLVDAVVLGNALEAVLSGKKPENYLEAYGHIRRPAAAEVLGLAGRLTKLATLPRGAPRTLRNLLLWVFDKLPMAKSKLVLSLSGLSREAATHLPL